MLTVVIANNKQIKNLHLFLMTIVFLFTYFLKSAYGTSPVNDLIQYRIEQAKRLMLYGNMRLNDIAEAVGFSSIYYFSKCFKKTVGVSPTVYKRNNLS